MQLCREDSFNPNVLRNQEEYINLQLELGQQSGEAEDFDNAKSYFSNALELVSCIGTVEGMLERQPQLTEKWVREKSKFCKFLLVANLYLHFQL